MYGNLPNTTPKVKLSMNHILNMWYCGKIYRNPHDFCAGPNYKNLVSLIIPKVNLG